MESDADSPPVDIARLDDITEDEVSQELESQLVIGGACSEEEYGKLNSCCWVSMIVLH